MVTVKVLAVLEHNVGATIGAEGSGLTVTVVTAELIQPLPSCAVTVYVVVTAGVVTQVEV